MYNQGRYQISFFSLEQLVPQDHLLRKIDQAIDFSFIYDLVQDKYSQATGRPSIDPVVLIKIVLIQYLFGIRSMRQTIKEIETNVAYRWFIGYDFTQPIPHFSTFGKNYVRRFRGTNLFETIFQRILEEAVRHGFVDPEVLFIDSTHVKASANKHKYTKTLIQEQSKKYQAQLEEEINQDRIAHGKKPLPKKHQPVVKEVKTSTTDPDSGLFVKSEKERVFAYSFHTACDRHGFVLGTHVTPAHVHDSQVFDEVLEKVTRRFGLPKAIALDAGYKTPYIAKRCLDANIRPVMPYTRPHTKDGFLHKHEYVYDEYYDCYICPQNEILEYETTTREGYRVYRSNPDKCKDCPLLPRCTESKDVTKRISRHIWAEYVEEAEHLRHTEENKRLYAMRKETIERVFADAKEKHGMRWTTLRGLEKVSMQAMLTFAAMNLKKLATWLWKSGGSKLRYLLLLSKLIQKQRIHVGQLLKQWCLSTL
ncbi:MAG: IS1182 family transposase [Desulfurispora sp.]|uniref:IS1182 family transposase n=1 Tax=Desulfurispora sp. TaxID=3014275 RepID=UPI00404A70D0